MAEKFKSHMMYKGSKAVKAPTYKKHLELKKQIRNIMKTKDF